MTDDEKEIAERIKSILQKSVAEALTGGTKISYTEQGRALIDTVVKGAILKATAGERLPIPSGLTAGDLRQSGENVDDWIPDDWEMWCSGWDVETSMPRGTNNVFSSRNLLVKLLARDPVFYPPRR